MVSSKYPTRLAAGLEIVILKGLDVPIRFPERADMGESNASAANKEG